MLVTGTIRVDLRPLPSKLTRQSASRMRTSSQLMVELGFFRSHSDAVSAIAEIHTRGSCLWHSLLSQFQCGSLLCYVAVFLGAFLLNSFFFASCITPPLPQFSPPVCHRLFPLSFRPFFVWIRRLRSGGFPILVIWKYS